MDTKDEIFELIEKEKRRQNSTLMMIPSENYTYPEVRKVVGSCLMHKYAEGYPYKRYYQGMKNVDSIETICKRRALEAFNLSENDWSVNVQPYSGTPANLAIYNALLKPGDTILAMFLPDGGHLSHGWEYQGNKITMTSKIYDIHFYHVDPKTLILDYDEIEKIAKEVRPKLIITGGTAYPREIDYEKVGKIAMSVNSCYLADVAHEAGLIAAGVCNSPFKYATAVTMTTHKTLRGPRGAIAFIRKDHEVDLDKSIFPGLQGGPHMHTIAGIAVALEKTKNKEFKEYADQTVKNAKYLAMKLLDGGLDVLTDGTDKHLVLVDLRGKKTNGWFVAWALEIAGIIANRNTIPYDTGSPYYPSGIRLGTPAITARGMKEAQMDIISDWILSIINHIGENEIPEDKDERARILKEFRRKIDNDKFLLKISEKVAELCAQFPIDLD